MPLRRYNERSRHMNKPKFFINDIMNQSSRTGKYMHDSLSDDILKDICKRITGDDEYNVQYDKKQNVGRKRHNPGSLLPTIMAFYVQSFVCVPSLSSPLLLRISPHTFAFIPIPPMCLSSRNRSNSKAFRHILPCIAPVC